MNKVIVFNSLSLDGYFSSRDGGVAWAKQDNGELTEYVRNSRGNVARYLFGRKTFEMFASFWPTPAGRAASPYFAQILTEGEKVVFSSSLRSPAWANTSVEPRLDRDTVLRLKKSGDGDSLIFGSGSVVRAFLLEGLIDEYQVVLNPIILGDGVPLFGSLPRSVDLRLIEAKAFENGTVLLRYESA
jgi:dihydrofolate reductase